MPTDLGRPSSNIRFKILQAMVALVRGSEDRGFKGTFCGSNRQGNTL